MATVRPGRCPVRGVRVRGRLGFGARGANTTAAFTLEQRDASKAARCLASGPRCVPGGARSAASACAAAWALAPGAQIPPQIATYSEIR